MCVCALEPTLFCGAHTGESVLIAFGITVDGLVCLRENKSNMHPLHSSTSQRYGEKSKVLQKKVFPNIFYRARAATVEATETRCPGESVESTKTRPLHDSSKTE